MRYFIGTKNGTVVGKHCFSGSDVKIDEGISKLRTERPDLVIEEVTLAVFDSTVVTPPKTQAQKDWEAFKGTSPTVNQSIRYLAQALGLE